MNILFVCTGNTCRSCMAETLANSMIASSAFEVEFSSAGIYAVKGQSASQNASRVMNEMGLDISRHISTPVSDELLNDATLILTLTEAHKNLIFSNYPNAGHKTFTLLEYIGENGDITDPFGGPIDTYRSCATKIKNSVEKLLLKLKES